MENPDANGFVNINWPSKSIPHGGIFHTRIVETSRAQQEFLKVLLEESKLSIVQRQKNAFSLRQEVKPETNYPEPLTVRPRTSHRRSLSAIRESGVLEFEEYRPVKRGEDREKLKDSLANKMAYGDSDEQKQITPALPRLPKQQFKLPTKKEQWNDLVTQIRERAEWLAEMEDLGHAGPQRQLVKDQIAERLRALDAVGVDSARSVDSCASGFSVVPSERSARSDRSAKTTRSQQSVNTQAKQRSKVENKPRKVEENVLAYEKFSPLQRSPRRRV